MAYRVLPEDIPPVEVEQFSEEYDVTKTEARERLSNQVDMGTVRTIAGEMFPDTFAGSYIKPELGQNSSVCHRG